MELMKCDHCGITEESTRIIHAKKYDMLLCRKHYLQKYKHGSFQESTSKDKNKIEIKETHAEIILHSVQQAGESSKEVARVLIDLEDIDKVKERKWSLSSKGYARNYTEGKNLFMHRLLIEVPDGFLVDHVNGNGLDNRKENLRLVTNQQNTMHRTKLNKNNSSGAVGVCYHRLRERWYARITLNGKTINLGSSKDFKEAVAMRKAGEEKYFGKYKPTIGGE